ncbi:MAG: hypothetical protein QME58_06455 [Bacteroidota bacterium]|nr:hypothetical protein [Bacteroidota bacterium]
MQRRMFILFLNLMLVSNILNAQFIELSLFPFLQIKPTFDINSRSDGMGRLAFIVDDPIRDVFINPAKSNLIKNNLTILSLSHTLVKNEFEQRLSPSLYNITHNEQRYTHLSSPIGGIFRLDRFLIGGKISYQSTEFKSEQVEEGYQRNVYKFESKETGYPFAAFMSYEFSDWVSFGLGVDKNTFKEKSTNFVNPDEHSKTDDLIVRGGLNMKINDVDKLSLLLSFYQSERELLFFDMTKGWVFQSDYKHKLNDALLIGGTFTLDKKKMDPYDGYSLKFGVGGIFQSGVIMLASEVSIEPAWLIYEYKPKEYGSYYQKSKYTFMNWSLKSGVQVNLTDELQCRFGFEYYKYQGNYEGKYDTVKYYIKPSHSTFIPTITTGLEYNFDNFNLIYNFNYGSQNHLLFSGFAGIQQTDLNPIFNRLMIIYNF